MMEETIQISETGSMYLISDMKIDNVEYDPNNEIVIYIADVRLCKTPVISNI